jgi:hypothetical protein
MIAWCLVFRYRPKVEAGLLTVDEAVRQATIDYLVATRR